jgi:hypothetical protein
MHISWFRKYKLTTLYEFLTTFLYCASLYNNKLEGLHQKPGQMEETRREGQNFFEVVAPQEDEESSLYIVFFMAYPCPFVTMTKFLDPQNMYK